MSRTHRNAHKVNYYPYRYPKTFNERKQLEGLMFDEDVDLSNRDKAKVNNLPDVYDDIVVNSYREDYTWKHHWDDKTTT